MRKSSLPHTLNQRRWVDEYLIDFTGAAAAIRAGYSEKSARSIAYENPTKADIYSIEVVGEELLDHHRSLRRPSADAAQHVDRGDHQAGEWRKPGGVSASGALRRGRRRDGLNVQSLQTQTGNGLAMDGK